MSADQLKNLKRTGVSARWGIVVTDMYGAEYAIPPRINIEVATWLYELGLRGPSPELGAAALNAVIEAGGVVGPGDICKIPK